MSHAGGDRADAAPGRGVLKPATWLALAAFGVAAWSQGAPLVALCAISSIVLAALPKGFTALSGLRFPAGLSTAILVFTASALLLGERGGLYVTTAWFDVALHLVAAAVLAQAGWALALLLTAGRAAGNVALDRLAAGAWPSR